MAFIISGLGKQFMANTTTTVAQALTPTKNDMKIVSNFIRDNTKKYWRPVAGAVVVGTCVYGAIKLRSEMLQARRQLKFTPTADEIENLSANASFPEVGAPLDVGLLGELNKLADDLVNELTLEQCLEVDSEVEKVIANGDDIDLELLEMEESGKSKVTIDKLKEKQDLQIKAKAKKRVVKFLLPQACKAMVAKLRTSFPTPNGSAIQQKAMALYLAKEGRKLKIRETQLAVLIPRAVALASVPTNAQIDMRVLMAIEPVELKFKRMEWKGDGVNNWLTRLVGSLPNIQ
jgi:predicted RNA-binding protein with RPS1 domain